MKREVTEQLIREVAQMLEKGDEKGAFTYLTIQKNLASSTAYGCIRIAREKARGVQ